MIVGELAKELVSMDEVSTLLIPISQLLSDMHPSRQAGLSALILMYYHGLTGELPHGEHCGRVLSEISQKFIELAYEDPNLQSGLETKTTKES